MPYRLGYAPVMAEPTGLEPAISGVTGRRVNQLHHGSTVLNHISVKKSWCGRRDLNPYRINSHKALNLARLPIPPLPPIKKTGADDRN